MPYSQDPNRVTELLPYLGLLVKGENCFWNLEGRKMPPSNFAYRIREALYIASLYPDRFPLLAHLVDKVVVEVKGTMVIGKFGRILDAPLPQQIIDMVSAHQSPPANRTFVPVAPTDYTMDMIDALWAKRSGTNINLPMYVPDREQLLRLYEWATPKKIMVMPSDNALTLIEWDTELDGMQFTPADNEESSSA